jgi:predicted DNA-binding WGR domain protein
MSGSSVYIPNVQKYPGIQIAGLKQAQFKLICTDAEHNKYYRIYVDGKGTLKTNYGRIGATAADGTINHTTPEAALHRASQLVRQKLKKGYVWEVPPELEIMDVSLKHVNSTRTCSKLEQDEKLDIFNSILNL